MGMSQYFAYNNYKIRSKKLRFVLVHIYSRISRMHGLVWIYRKVKYKSTNRNFDRNMYRKLHNKKLAIESKDATQFTLRMKSVVTSVKIIRHSSFLVCVVLF